ncbi:hypothetical protein L3X38_028100 [Prunus dulcis]|uniref:Uncharacterized protein n=1 Tax=Prunus dulcis TaxID=3755 RepID=A0AAD4Z1R6_PRUDU|nr:hypothetical protein L3X38_028100 [Prunus dulcis]
MLFVDARNGPANIESNLVMRYVGSSAGKRAEALGEIGWEVKVGGLHKVPMWDFVQVIVVATRVLEIRFGSWELRQVSGTSEVSSFDREEGVAALVLVALMLGFGL